MVEEFIPGGILNDSIQHQHSPKTLAAHGEGEGEVMEATCGKLRGRGVNGLYRAPFFMYMNLYRHIQATPILMRKEPY